MKYRDNMTPEELAQFKKALQAQEDAYAGAAKHDAQNPDEWEDPSDYVGMGWIDSRGRP